MAPCLPGAEITEAGDDGTYRGTFSSGSGRPRRPTAASCRWTEVDEAAHRVVMRASGQDKRGQGSAKATIVSTMSEEAGVTTVEIETDFTITGRLARFGRGGMIQDVSNRLLRDFSDCLQKSIEGAAPNPAPSGAEPTEAAPSRAAPRRPSRSAASRSLVRALFDRIRRLFRRER